MVNKIYNFLCAPPHMDKIIAAVYFAYRLSLSVEAMHQEVFPCGALFFGNKSYEITRTHLDKWHNTI